MEFEQLQTARHREQSDLDSELKAFDALEDTVRAKQSVSDEEAKRMEATQMRMHSLQKQLLGAQSALTVHRRQKQLTEARCRAQKCVHRSLSVSLALSE